MSLENLCFLSVDFELCGQDLISEGRTLVCMEHMSYTQYRLYVLKNCMHVRLGCLSWVIWVSYRLWDVVYGLWVVCMLQIVLCLLHMCRYVFSHVGRVVGRESYVM